MPSENFGSAKLLTEGGPFGSSIFNNVFWQHKPQRATMFYMGHEISPRTVKEMDRRGIGTGVVWRPTEQRGMSLTFGPTRTGKGTSLIVPALLIYSGSMLVIDVKGENAWLTADRRRALGQKVVIFDPSDEVNRSYGSKAGQTERTIRYNPLAHIDPQSLTFNDDCAAQGEAVIINSGSGGDNSSFFNLSARDGYGGIVAAWCLLKPGHATLRDVRETIVQSDKDFGLFCEKIVKAFPGTVAAKKLAQFVDMEAGGNSSIKQTMKQQTSFLDSEEILRATEPAPGEETFTFDELTSGRITIYLVMSMANLVTWSPLLRLLMNQALRPILKNRGKLDQPVCIIGDEAQTALGNLTVLKTAFNLTSGLGLIVWLFYQDLPGLKATFPDAWESFIGNSATIQIVHASENTTAEYFSKYMGMRTVATESTSVGESGGIGNFNESTNTTTGETGVPVMRPEQIIDLPDNRMLVLFPSHVNYKLEKPRYFADGRLTGMYRPDPNYPPPPPFKPAPYIDDAELDRILNADALQEQAERTAATPQPKQNVGRDFFKPAQPYTGSRKIGAIAALAFFGFMLLTAFNQAGPYFNTPWHVLFAVVTALTVWALQDRKHRLAVVGVAVFFEFLIMQASRQREGFFGVLSHPLELVIGLLGCLFWVKLFGLPLIVVLWPLLLLDGAFRVMLRLVYLNGFTAQGKVIGIVQNHKDHPGERFRVLVETLAFVMAINFTPFAVFRSFHLGFVPAMLLLPVQFVAFFVTIQALRTFGTVGPQKKSEIKYS